MLKTRVVGRSLLFITKQQVRRFVDGEHAVLRQMRFTLFYFTM